MIPTLRTWTGPTSSGISFFCPGCQDAHSVPTTGPNAWQYNGNPDSPTLSPSLLVRSGHYAQDHKAGDPCWCTWKDPAKPGEPSPFSCQRCHSYVQDGHIRFLGDCSHASRGQTLPLPAWPQGYEWEPSPDNG